jgi:hypothetical protein
VSQKYPDEETIVYAVRKVMLKKPRIDSQREFAALVTEALKEEDPDIRISASRIRKVAVTSGVVKLDIGYRETDRSDLPDLCPVCGSGMSPVINNTLDGDITEIKRNCTVCPYSVGKTVLVPGKYVFIRTAGRELTEQEIRLRKLRKAASLLRKASRLIGESLDGTNFPQRQDYAQEMIDEILHSREMTGSIPNLKADIRAEAHSDPLWTKPLSSPKYPERKVFDERTDTL